MLCAATAPATTLGCVLAACSGGPIAAAACPVGFLMCGGAGAAAGIACVKKTTTFCDQNQPPTIPQQQHLSQQLVPQQQQQHLSRQLVPQQQQQHLSHSPTTTP
jgi:hypothetical protein